MAVYNLIATTTVGSGGAATIDFTSIPQTYTDLRIVLSARTTNAAIRDFLYLKFNGSTTGWNERRIFADGTSAASFSSSTSFVGYVDGANATSSVFGNQEIYIPNYTSATYKSLSGDSVTETNATLVYSSLGAILWSNTAAITSITLYLPDTGASFVQYSSASLYGIKNS
jgi:hypothetical protein